MASNVGDEQLEHLIMCAVCLEHLKSPKMLYCGHTFCKLCLTSIVAKNKKRDTLSCPECRTEHKIPPAGIDGFPDNRTAAAFVEIYQKKQGNQHQAGMHCLECGLAHKTKKCEHCQKSLCPECLEFHAKQLLQETRRLAEIFQREVSVVSQRYFETKEAHISQLAKSREDAKTELAEFCKSGMQALQTVQDKWMTELQTQFEREQEAFGATEEEMKMKIAEILSQLEAASKCSVEAHTTAETAAIVAVGESGATAPSAAAQYLDVTKIMDLNRECRKRIAQIGEIKGLSGDTAPRVVARRMEFRHVTPSTFEKNFMVLGKVLVTSNGSDSLPNLPSIVAVPSAGVTGDGKLFKGTRAGKCYNVAPSYTTRYYLRLNNRSSEGYGDLLYPWGVATTKDDQIIVVDDGNQRIHFFEADGVPLRTFSAATGATLTALAEQGGGQQHTQNTSPGIHAAAAQPEARPQPQGTLPSSTNGAEAAAAAAPKATVAVPVAAAAVPPMATRSVEREESSSSASVEREGTSHAAEPMFLEPSFRYISGVCVDDKNRLCITEEDTARLYFYSVGGELEQTVELGGNVKPRAVCLDTQDNIYVSDVENCCIYKYNYNGELLQSFGGRSVFSRPSFLALSCDEEKLIVSDTLSHRVFIMSAHTGEIITSFGGMKGHHDLMFEGPCGIAIDGAGNINVVDSGNNRIQVITMNGVYVSEIALPWYFEATDMPGGFRDVALLSSGKYALTDHANHRIVIL
ncbi:RING finger protein nhl-1-like isoform X2 [Symsagittifera roscoffensis]|uniref:RING finger protein nhl-1-like isoform X2 n=1 Tax=Symsagittifera roscoffensis TaxID=84072 RepID=UPI00307C3F83